jgi:hypothetical protein
MTMHRRLWQRGFSVLVLAGWVWLTCPLLSSQSEKIEEGLDPSEIEAVQKAKTPEEKLKVYLNISNERMKAIASATRKENTENLVKAVGGFRAALNQAEDLLSPESPTSSAYRKLAEPLLRAARKHSANLLETLKNAQEDLRKYIQAALEVSERIVAVLALQLEKNNKK